MLFAYRFTSLTVCLIAVVIGATPAATAAEAKSSLVVVLDGSGSMWGRIGAEPKIVAAKKVMREILKDVPDDVALAFVAYGHRRKGDCGDIETIAPLGTRPAAVATAVDRIQPTGKTPITTALRHGAGVFKSTDTPSTLVLVSDGIETCKGDPCALAKELKTQGVKLVIHTVGFGVGDKAAKQLQCIANAGGGNYYHAKDSAALSKALFAVRKAVVENKPAPKPKPIVIKTKPAKTKSKVIRIIGPGTIKLRPAPWVKMPVYYWKAVDPETGEEKGQSKRDHLKIKGGEYQLVWRQTRFASTEVPLTEIVNVANGKTVTVPVDTGLKIVVPEGMKAPYQWWLRRTGDDKRLATYSGTLDPQVVPAGRYELGWHQYRFKSRPVSVGLLEIQGGKLNQFAADHGFQARAADWAGSEPYGIWLVKADGAKLGPWQTFETHLAPAGTYKVLYHHTRFQHSQVVWGEITIPENGLADLKIDSGVKFKLQSDVKPPYRAFFVNLDTGKETFWGGAQDWKPVPLPPGRYRLDWWEKRFETKRMTLVDEFEIEAGTLVEFEM